MTKKLKPREYHDRFVRVNAGKNLLIGRVYRLAYDGRGGYTFTIKAKDGLYTSVGYYVSDNDLIEYIENKELTLLDNEICGNYNVIESFQYEYNINKRDLLCTIFKDDEVEISIVLFPGSYYVLTSKNRGGSYVLDVDDYYNYVIQNVRKRKPQ